MKNEYAYHSAEGKRSAYKILFKHCKEYGCYVTYNGENQPEYQNTHYFSKLAVFSRYLDNYSYYIKDYCNYSRSQKQQHLQNINKNFHFNPFPFRKDFILFYLWYHNEAKKSILYTIDNNCFCKSVIDSEKITVMIFAIRYIL